VESRRALPLDCTYIYICMSCIGTYLQRAGQGQEKARGKTKFAQRGKVRKSGPQDEHVLVEQCILGNGILQARDVA